MQPVLHRGVIAPTATQIAPIGGRLQVVSDYEPAGDQPKAIASLVGNIREGAHDQTLLGVTGSGKTFTMAHVIQATQRPALILAHNKTLAAQLYHEMKSFFPNNAVEYFVSYYDYYQPEAYVPCTDTFIEKDAQINEQIDRMRHAATRSLLERSDVIVVASVSCIYGIGSVETYYGMRIALNKGQVLPQRELLAQLIALQYRRNDTDFHRGCFRLRGDNLDIFPAHLEDRAWRVSLFGDEIEQITEFDPLTGETTNKLDSVTVYANSHYVTPKPTIDQAIKSIKEELKQQLEFFHSQGRLLEAQRLEQRTMFDLEMLQETGMCRGIENYSRYLSGNAPGAPPPTLFQYLPKNALLFVDESHVTVPQIGGMYNGDRARKTVLAEHGFRLPSCMDNRPLKFEEWDMFRPDTVFVSATPSEWEIKRSNGKIAEQIIRPTGLIDPVCIIRPVAKQVDDLLAETHEQIKRNQRVLVTTLTKRMAEELADYMQDAGIKVLYLHSDIETLERIEIIRRLRLGDVDVLIGVNLLREGLDIPECGLMAILDADKEGFLRSRTALIQTIGRAARNVNSKVILYADVMTDSLKGALEETERRRTIQHAWNVEHGITPESVKKQIHQLMDSPYEKDSVKGIAGEYNANGGHNIEAHKEHIRAQMLEAAANLEFETAARLRDELKKLEDSGAEPMMGEPGSGKKSRDKRAAAQGYAGPKRKKR